MVGITQKKINLHHLGLSKVRLCGEGSSDKATTSRLEPLVFLAKYPETTNITCLAIPKISRNFLLSNILNDLFKNKHYVFYTIVDFTIDKYKNLPREDLSPFFFAAAAAAAARSCASSWAVWRESWGQFYSI